MIYAIITVACQNNPNILIHVFLITNVYYLVYVGYADPHDAPLGRRQEYMNEIFLQLTTYHLALFPLAPTLADEELAGWSMVGSLGAVFMCNLMIMIGVTVIGLKRKCYLRKLKKEHEKRMQERSE